MCTATLARQDSSFIQARLPDFSDPHGGTGRRKLREKNEMCPLHNQRPAPHQVRLLINLILAQGAVNAETHLKIVRNVCECETLAQ